MGPQYAHVEQCVESPVVSLERVGDHRVLADGDDGEWHEQGLIMRDKAAALEITVDDKTYAKDEVTEKKPPQRSDQSRTKFLNGLRGLAALLVAHFHAGYLDKTYTGQASVDIFFVLSAFLLTMLNEVKFAKMFERKARAREWVTTLADYFVKRILRVYPLFALVAVVLTCLPEATRTRYYKLERYHIKHWSLFDVLTFDETHRYYLFWTLPIEIAYYFVIPLFVAGAYLLGRLKWMAVALLYIWVYHEGGHTYRVSHGDFRGHVSTFVAGSLAATVYCSLSRWTKRTSFEPRAWQLVLLRIFEAVMIGSVISDTTNGLFARWFHGTLFPTHDRRVPFISLPVSSVIMIECLVPSSIARALEWNVLCYAGKVSFSMYLLHPFLNYQPWLMAMPVYDQFVVRLVLLFPLATASYLVVERPLQRLAVVIGKRLQKYNNASGN